jgi:DNA polymerase-3 subunit epsilon
MNMMIVDVETDGIPLWHEPSDDPRQPHLVQYTAVLFDAGTGEEEEFTTLTVRPDGWTIPAELVAIHGITTEQATKEGVPLREVVNSFISMTARADLVAAYGIEFDLRIMRIAMLRCGFTKAQCGAHRDSMRTHCVQRQVTPLCRLPPTDKMMRAGRKTWKTPTLTEAVAILLHEELDDAHDSRADVLATKRVFMVANREKRAVPA